MRKRISLLAAGGLVALGLATTPAHAADPVFTLAGPAEVGLRPHPGQNGQPQKTSVEFRVVNDSTKTFAHQSTFTIDLGALKGIADVKLAEQQGANCTLTATAVTCKRWALWTGDTTVVDLDLTAAKDSKVGATAALTVTGQAEGATFKPATTKVRVGGPDLVLEKAKLKAEQKPGDKQNLSVVFANEGTDPVNGVVLEVRTTHGIGLVEQYDNCSYSEDSSADQPWNTGWSTVQCLLEGEYEPGAVYGLDGSLTLKAAPHAFIDGLTYAVYAAGDQPKTAKQRTPAGGKKLSPAKRAGKASAQAAPRTGDLDPWDNIQEFDFATRNTADLVGTGVSLKGKAGETVKADFGFRNNGPAWVAYLRSGEDVARTDIVIPAGARVTKVPAGCTGVNADGSQREQALGAPRYFCSTGHVVGEAEKFAYPFELKIEKVVADAKGSVTVGQWTPEGTTGHRWDPDHANNKAAFVINAKDGGPAPTPTTSVTPTPTGSATPTATATATASATATSGTGTTANGGLASTGSSAQMIALGGAVLLAVGGGLFVAFRRKAGGHA
ncbi:MULTISPECIES: LPXTG cell wall anchor domain-containing protein [unclassified Streptomyces]|uniref:LPXTG cell wall anchor domain-containing protein n=1 Tax=unclassified Streptomyces TaxID=2593676 RepID=UPI0032436B85